MNGPPTTKYKSVHIKVDNLQIVFRPLSYTRNQIFFQFSARNTFSDKQA